LRNEVHHIAGEEMSSAGAAIMAELVEYFAPAHDTVESISRRLYKSTACGAWLNLDRDSLNIGSIVEGSDVDCTTHTLTAAEYLRMDEGDLAKWLDAAIKEIEAEAEVIWHEWNSR
jgi:hypothetical protein